VENMTEIKNI